ncbi:hypothetical protein NUW58_g2255 [Xylaria curta]|uniref:Uncharacterized protein n=1 Tax=Xylaria curta TaxID=42375 RepID=A0ACC1PI24_9PEZI|nr:hypothetical protein NUW58_g2255 [Xylaria curta]
MTGSDRDMRLRLVVRRNGLPELRLMWHAQLDSNPTISKLLEQLNDHVPLESEHWGLEDYVVELHDSDGTDFECLHYQLVRSVLKPDDRVFIRALDRDDHRRRRMSGRLQISADGRHLIDGVPFGRPHLRASTGRPAIHIPPRKRARLTYTQRDGEDASRDPASESDSPALLLTNGEPHGDDYASFDTRITDEHGDAVSDDDADDTDYAGDDAELSSSSNESQVEGESESDAEAETDASGDVSEEADDLNQEARDLAADNHVLNGGEEHPLDPRATSLDTLDKLTALRAAFPTALLGLCEDVLAASSYNLKIAYNVLSEGFKPQMSQEAIVAWKPGLGNQGAGVVQPIVGSASTRKRKHKESSPVDESDNGEDEGHNADLWRKYDHAGFPPGTITSGAGLNHMAAISASFDSGKINGNSEVTSTTLKATTEDPIEEDDDTSSSGDTSDSSDTSSSRGSSDSDDTSNIGSSSDSSDGLSDESDSDPDGSSDESDDADEEDSSSEGLSSLSNSSDSDDSGSETSEGTTRAPKRSRDNDGHLPLSPTSGSDTSDSDSDSGPEEYPFETISRGGPTAKSKEASESSESSDTPDSGSDSDSSGTNLESKSEEDAGDGPDNEVLATKAVTTTKSPPGAGKQATKRRNARRRVAKLLKRDTQDANVLDNVITSSTREIASTGDGHILDNEVALFEAKRKALLDAIATGGIEVGPSGETTFDQNFTETGREKRKRAEGEGSSPQHPENEAAAETTEQWPNDGQDGLDADQKRRRIDLGAGRRMVFSALGLRNPKNKVEEYKLRNRLQADAQHPDRLPRPRPATVTGPMPSGDNEQEDLHDWKAKINYRAVECCQDGIELSPAPFPFQQRWDPQQQTLSFSKKNKRGGQSKRAQRNQAHYYDDDSHASKKKKRSRSHEISDRVYGHAYDGEYDATNGVDVALNYDDIESDSPEDDNNPANGTSQATDLDDLPSLPQDISGLPTLRPGEARVGMVITWQKWSCSSATSWQPQLSRVTAIVAKIDDDAVALGVCLAKRDRYLNGNEKRYDHRTGQRIYDKFEAPDLGEEDEADDEYADADEDEGYQNLSWADMQDPRILQQPLNTISEAPFDAECLDSIEMDGTSIAIENRNKETELRESSQREAAVIADPVQPTSKGNISGDILMSGASPRGKPGDSSLGPYLPVSSNSTSHQAGQNQQTTDAALSDISQISSPSRQLHETTSQAIGSNSPVHHWARTSGVERTESLRLNTSSSIPLPPTISSHAPIEELESDIFSGTPSAELPHVADPSSASSIRSGRQPDYAIDVDGDVSDPFEATDGIDPHHCDHESDSLPRDDNSPTPIPTHRTMTPNGNEKMTPKKGTRSSPLTTPTPGSLSSLSSLFCTAVTSHSTQSPSRAMMSSIISKSSTSRFASSTKYDEAMRKLDEQFDNSSDDESWLPATNSLEVKQEDSTQPLSRFLPSISPPLRRGPSLPSASPRRPPSRQPNASNPTYRRTASNSTVLSDRPSRRRSSRPFTIPPGSQVVELSSDSEPVYTEDYADEDIDGTYSPELGSMPNGIGWVRKKRRNTRRSVV